jgi:hypothetical protein
MKTISLDLMHMYACYNAMQRLCIVYPAGVAISGSAGVLLYTFVSLVCRMYSLPLLPNILKEGLGFRVLGVKEGCIPGIGVSG